MKIITLIVAEIVWLVVANYSWALLSLCSLPMIFHSSVLYGISTMLVYLIMLGVGFFIAYKILTNDD